MRLLVTGVQGQVARAVSEAAHPAGVDVMSLGRPDIDLAHPEGIAEAMIALAPDVVVNAAAYTAVDQAETEEAEATAINARGAAAVAAAAARIGAPLIHLSTDYVFDGASSRAYVEDDAINPTSAYGRSKAAGEIAVAKAQANHVILRTAWVYSPYGKNFLRTMLRLAEARDVVRVVADQRGAPTSALDIADAIILIAHRLMRDDDPHVRGLFHMTGAGAASWADFAEAIFAESAARGGPSAAVERIATTDYPTPARRPANSALDCGKLQKAFGLQLPPWRESVGAVVQRCLAENMAQNAKTSDVNTRMDR